MTRCDARAATGACWPRSRCYRLGGGTSILVVRKLGLIDLVSTGISSCLVAVNGEVHLVTMAVALMAAALRSRLSLSPLLLTALLGGKNGGGGGGRDDDIERFAPHGGRSTGRGEIR